MILFEVLVVAGLDETVDGGNTQTDDIFMIEGESF